jgi:hypothetical protein
VILLTVSYHKLINNNVIWYVLHGVPGVLAIDTGNNLLFAIKSEQTYINPLLVNNDVRFGGCRLRPDWGWCDGRCEYVPTGYNAYWATSNITISNGRVDVSCIVEEFEKIKEVHDTNRSISPEKIS